MNAKTCRPCLDGDCTRCLDCPHECFKPNALKVLFLDIDGVVNCVSTTQRHRGAIGIDPHMAFRVGKIQLDTGCAVVLSSSWRLLPDGREEVERQVVKLLDVTPDLRGTTDRGCEVIAWLSQHPEVTRHAILDDNSDFHKDQPLFKTNWDTGLTDEIAAEVTSYLNALAPHQTANQPHRPDHNQHT